MFIKLFLMVIAFVLGIYVANTYHVNLADTFSSFQQDVDKKAE